jgi:hypothetical protein
MFVSLSTIAAVALSFTGLVSAQDIVNNGNCNENNCFRVVQRKWQGPEVYSSHIADCKASLGCTSVPAATVTTATVTESSGVTTLYISASTVQPTNVPSSVSACNSIVPAYATQSCALGPGGASLSAYASACSCAGALPTTNVGATPTVTATVTQTVPASIVYVVTSA